MDKRTKKKRNCTGGKRWGWVLVICTFIVIVPTENYPSVVENIKLSMVCLLPGVALLVRAYFKSSVWNKLETAINNRGNTPIDEIASKLGKDEKWVEENLQDMVNRGFFQKGDSNAYVDGINNLFVVTENGMPMESIDEGVKRNAERQEFKAQSEAIRKLRKIIALLEDESMVELIRALEKSIKSVENTLLAKPELKNDKTVIKMHNEYLPAVLNLADKLSKDHYTAETKAQICESLKTCTEAFENINEQLNESDNIMTQVDIDVLKAKIAEEGFLDPDFVIEEN